MIILETMALEAIILEITTIIMKLKEGIVALEMIIKRIIATQKLQETMVVSEAIVATKAIAQEATEVKQTNQEIMEAVLEAEVLQEMKAIQ